MSLFKDWQNEINFILKIIRHWDEGGMHGSET